MHRSDRRRTSASTHLWHTDYLVIRALQRDLRTQCGYLQGRVLDLGCGNQPYRPLLTNVATYVPYDIDAQGSKPDVVGTAQLLPFADASFDGVLSTQVLEHVREPWTMAAEIARVLRPGGTVVLSAPQAWRLHEQPHDYFRYTIYGLSALCERVGLEPIETLNQGGAWAQVGQTVNNTLWVRHAVRRFSLGWVLRRLGTVAINLSCSLLDRLWYDSGETLNYVVRARKRTAPLVSVWL